MRLKEAVWRGDNRKTAIGQLCRELEKAAAGAQSEFGGSMRLLFRVTACADVQLEEVERCAETLTAYLSGKQMALFCARTASNVGERISPGLVPDRRAGQQPLIPL